MDIFSLQLELITGKIQKVKKQIEILERQRRNSDIGLSSLKKIQRTPRTQIATSTPKLAGRHKREFKPATDRTTDSDRTIESIDTSDSDCELIEQPSDLIVLDDNSNTSNSATDSSANDSISANTTQQTSPAPQTCEVVTEQIGENDSSCLFYEDREPSTKSSVPLYDSVQCIIVDSSVENSEDSTMQSKDKMKIFTIRNENYNRTGGIKDRLGNRYPKIIDETMLEQSTSKSISFDTPSVPKMNMRISVEPTENELTTRTCTITSSSAESSEPSSTSNNDSKAREVSKATIVGTNAAPQSQPKPLKITIANDNALSTSVAVNTAGEVPKTDSDSSIVVQNELKRRRKDSDVVVIDETLSDSRRDDSVIFVSESMNTKRPDVSLPGKHKGSALITFGKDFIPITATKRESPPSKLRRTKSTRAQRKSNKKAERRQALLERSRPQRPSSSKVAKPIEAPHNNNDGEKEGIKDPNQLEKRMIIIDGSNVAFGHGGQQFSVKGIDLCLNYFLSRGFEAKAVIPKMRTNGNKSTDPKRLDELYKADKLVLTPCKNLPGQRSISYDDRIILDIAANFDAAIISNDNYGDLVDKKPEWNEIIKNRVVGFTWCKDLIIFPNDPYGRQGPTLNQILYKPKPENK